MDDRETITRLNGALADAQAVLKDYLGSDDGTSAEDAIERLIGILDDKDLVKMQADLRSGAPSAGEDDEEGWKIGRAMRAADTRAT